MGRSQRSAVRQTTPFPNGHGGWASLINLSTAKRLGLKPGREIRVLQHSDRPELAWLKDEFHLNDAELHAAYLPQCRETCRKIDAQNDQLQKLLASATNATPEIDKALAETARLRSDCQGMMLRHFFQVSQTMPPEQGRRYLAWVKEKAFLPDYGMNERP